MGSTGDDMIQHAAEMEWRLLAPWPRKLAVVVVATVLGRLIGDSPDAGERTTLGAYAQETLRSVEAEYAKQR
jgi:hypothetical protein